jgi:hemoglobin-like flavoprotein
MSILFCVRYDDNIGPFSIIHTHVLMLFFCIIIYKQTNKLTNKQQIRFGTIMPEAMAVFGFSSDQMNHTDMSKNRLFISHAKRFVQMLGSAVGMLGPNLEMLTDILNELGQKHIAYGVKPAYFSAMGIALLDALESCDEKYTKEIEMSWREVYNAISLDMIRAYE